MKCPVNRIAAALVALPLFGGGVAIAQSPKQPRVQPGPVEPDWIAILDAMYGLRMFDDLANPAHADAVHVPGRFKKAGPGLVTFRPEIALGLEVTIRGGWYRASDNLATPPTVVPAWSYQFKNTSKDIENGTNLPPKLGEVRQVEFDPGDGLFGLAVSNDQFHDTVYTEPKRVAAHNPRLAKQPYKVMIYPYKDKATGRIVPHSYLLGWEYSTNDDFQDVVCRVDNVILIP